MPDAVTEVDAHTTVPEKILFAAVDACREEFPIEELILACWKRWPHHFGLRGYLRVSADASRVRRWFCERRGVVHYFRWIERASGGHYRVTAAGRAHQRAVAAWLRWGATGPKPDGAPATAPPLVPAAAAPAVVITDPETVSLISATPVHASVVARRPARATDGAPDGAQRADAAPPAPLLILSPHERSELISRASAVSTERDMARRASAVLKFADGASLAGIARSLEMQRADARKWIRRFQQHRLWGLENTPPPGRPPRVAAASSAPRRARAVAAQGA